MTRFVEEREVARLRAAKPESFQARLYAALRERTDRNTRHPGFVQPGDTQEWWHLCWERASDAAFVWHMERDAALGEWLRGVAFWLRDLEDVEWIGPWYRDTSRPLRGIWKRRMPRLQCAKFWICAMGCLPRRKKKA